MNETLIFLSETEDKSNGKGKEEYKYFMTE